MIEREFRINTGSVSLAASLCLPGTDNPNNRYPAALLINGSGSIDRNTNTRRLQLNIMSTIAHHLAENGIASLRYDKRGCGQSLGDYLSSGHDDHVDDAVAAAQFLIAHEAVIADRVFVIGHSEGAVIAPQVSVSVAEIDSIVLVCPYVQDFSELLRDQAEHVNEKIGGVGGFTGFLSRWILRIYGDPERVQKLLLKRLAENDKPIVRLRGKKINARWFRQMLSLDVRGIYERVICPVLIIGAAKDVQCDPSDVLEIRMIVNGPVSSYVLPDLTHILREDSEPASILNYNRLRALPVSEMFLTHLSDWLRARL